MLTDECALSVKRQRSQSISLSILDTQLVLPLKTISGLQTSACTSAHHHLLERSINFS